jgi:uncharacterized protein (DUF302 family)
MEYAQAIVKVSYGAPSRAAVAFQHQHRSQFPLDEAVVRLRSAIQGAGLWVLHEIDPQALLLRGGFAINPARQILFFHPRFMVRILAADPTALLEAPLKYAAMASDDGSTIVRWFDPVVAFARYGNPELKTLGEELAELSAAIVNAALEPRAAARSAE